MSFDHRDAGTSESVWADDPRWERTATADGVLDGVLHGTRPGTGTGGRRALVIAAHPDDETLGAGGLVARLHDRGVAITLLLATAGEGSHGAGLAPTRSMEFAAAIDRLAPGAALLELGLPDGALHERAAALTGPVARAAERCELVVAPWRGDGHGDHRVAGEVAAAVAARAGIPLLEYPIWLWHWAAPPHPAVPWCDLLRLELTDDERRRKADALDVYASQTSVIDGEPPILHEGMLAHFRRPWESFVVAAS